MSVIDLLSAAFVENLDFLQQLLDVGLSPGAATAAGWTALHAAAMAGQLEAMQLLVQRGAPVTATTVHGCAPLHSASRTGQQPEAMQLLLDAGADVSAADHNSHPPLYQAICAGNLSAVQILLAAGASYKYDLIIAAGRGHLQLVRLFLSKGAGLGQRWPEDGNAAQHEAARFGHVRVLQELLAAGADVNTVDAQGGTVLHDAAAYGFCEVVQLWLANGAKVNA